MICCGGQLRNRVGCLAFPLPLRIQSMGACQHEHVLVRGEMGGMIDLLWSGVREDSRARRAVAAKQGGPAERHRFWDIRERKCGAGRWESAR